MRTTTLIVSLAMLGLAATAPTASAVSTEPFVAPHFPCTHEGDSTLDDVINATYQVRCIARDLVQNEIYRADEDVQTGVDTVNAVIQAARDICENRLGERPCAVFDATDVHINPNVHEWEWSTLEALA